MYPILRPRCWTCAAWTSGSVAATAAHAVKQLDFTLGQGETLALVGESGCGKSTTALALLRLLAPEARIAGEVRFRGQDLVRLPLPQLRAIRGGEISMIFQEPMTSLNPVHTVGAQIVESLRCTRACRAKPRIGGRWRCWRW